MTSLRTSFLRTIGALNTGSRLTLYTNGQWQHDLNIEQDGICFLVAGGEVVYTFGTNRNVADRKRNGIAGLLDSTVAGLNSGLTKEPSRVCRELSEFKDADEYEIWFLPSRNGSQDAKAFRQTFPMIFAVELR